MRKYTTRRHVHTTENRGVITATTYSGGRTSSNSHSTAVDHLFQNMGIAARMVDRVQPKPKRIQATRLFMYLRLEGEEKMWRINRDS